MFRVSAEQLECMRQKIDHSFERIDRAGRTPRQIQNQRLSSDSADSPAEGGKRRLLRAFVAHAFGDSFEQAFAHGAGGFGSDIALGDSSPAGGDYELCFLNPV